MALAGQQELTGGTTAPGQARTWLCTQLREATSNDLLDDSRLCVSELVTNAIQANCCTVVVRYELDDGQLRVGVFDDAAGLPSEQQAQRGDSTGRGLFIIAELSSRWGITPAAGGKEVWVEFDVA